MRAVNVFLALVVSAILGLLVLELGLRLLGKRPQPSINRFDPDTGWSKTPGAKTERETGEFHVRYEINALGLRDDLDMASPGKPAGTFRVLMLGDSFLLGYTVDRRDLFADLLENWWRAEGRAVDVVNTGTEGWSTDQEVAWFEKNGAAFQPDVVVLLPYENDLYWNSQTHYRRFPKPRYTPFGDRERLVLMDPGPKPWYEHTALGSTWSAMSTRPVTWSVVPDRHLQMEWGAYFRTPPEFMTDAIGRTRGALTALKAECLRTGAKLYVAPIPGKAVIEELAGRGLARALNPRTFRESLPFSTKPAPLDPASWSPDQPVETFLALARELDVPALDARAALRAAAADGTHLYFQQDWHLNAQGNRAFARFLHDELDRSGAFPPALAPTRTAAMPVEAAPKHFPAWVLWYAGLWLVISTLYALTYKDEPWWKAALGVAVMLGLVFTIAIGGGALLKLLPPQLSMLVLLLVVATLLTFIVFKLGRRIGTITELFTAFTRRGHWYLMPLVVVLLSVGSLLVVAASSPLIAPFIYTLF